jgi:predicted RNA binding protein YcfA (HicA-like mRNA interferase family)
MSKLKSISVKKLILKLNDLGFDDIYTVNKHSFILDDNLRLTLPIPSKKEISIDLLARILKQARIKIGDWIAIDKTKLPFKK